MTPPDPLQGGEQTASESNARSSCGDVEDGIRRVASCLESRYRRMFNFGNPAAIGFAVQLDRELHSHGLGLPQKQFHRLGEMV